MLGVRRSNYREYVVADELTHLDEQGRLKMVDVGGKEPTARLARVRGEIRMDRATARLIAKNKVAKGSVLEAARLAGIMAAKRTGELIPLCHSAQPHGGQRGFARRRGSSRSRGRGQN